MTAATESTSFGPARYVVGIDLGTSHTVVAHAPLAGQAGDIALLDIPQRSTAGEVVARADTEYHNMKLQMEIDQSPEVVVGDPIC